MQSVDDSVWVDERLVQTGNQAGDGEPLGRCSDQFCMGDAVKTFLFAAVNRGLKYFPIDACSALGAIMAKNASRRYAELDARARENLKQIQPEQSDPTSIDATMSRLWRSVARNKAELIVLVRLWPAGRSAVQGVEFLDAARAANRPILGIVLHLGNWEAMGVACQAIGYPVAALYLPEENQFEKLKEKVQGRYGADLIPAGPGAMRAAVRNASGTQALSPRNAIWRY